MKRKWFDGVISQFPLSQLVSECTRVSAKTSSLLDHIYVYKSQMYCRTQVLQVYATEAKRQASLNEVVFEHVLGFTH